MTLLSYGLLLTIYAMVLVQNLYLLVGLVAVQALLLGAQSIALGWRYGDTALYWAAALTFIIKGGIIPLFLRYTIRRIRVIQVVDGIFTIKVTLLIAIGLTLAAYYATGGLITALGPEGEFLPVALTIVLIGLFLMVSRRVALTQAIGLLVIENGMFLAALATTRGLPVLVDIGIFFDVLVSAIVMGMLVFRINATIDSLDTQELRRLRG